MHHTMFDTPIISTLLRWLSMLILKLCGWKVESNLPPDLNKCVMIAAPHTSNWDLPFTLWVAFALNLRIYWMGKDAIFMFPFRRLMMWMGGVPVDRSKANNMVAASVDAINENEHLILIVPPEGTRSKVTVWKSGFYHIAAGANVPILLGFLDYGRKVGGIGPIFQPSGDIEKDMLEIKAFYSTVQGKNSDQFHSK